MNGAVLIADIGTNTVCVGSGQQSRPEYYLEALGQTGVWDSQTVDFDQYYHALMQSTLLPKAQAMLIVESVMEPDPFLFKSKLCELVFERNAHIPHLSFQYAPVLTSFATARQSALVLDMSAGGCTSNAVVDGWLLRGNREHSDMGFVRYDAYANGFTGPVTLNNCAQFNEFREQREFTLPDETKIQRALFDCTDIDSPAGYFVPLPEMIVTTATRNNLGNETRKALLHNIVPCGGMFLHDLIAPRLLAETKQFFVSDACRLVCGAETNRTLTSWIGGSILSSLSIFEKELCVTRQEYAEHGLDILSKRFA